MKIFGGHSERTEYYPKTPSVERVDAVLTGVRKQTENCCQSI